MAKKTLVQGFHFYTFGLLRRLYDWVMKWAYSKYGTAALAANAFAESSFFPIPPDALLMALSVSRPKRAYWYAFICSVFSILGAFLGYSIGYVLYDTIGKWVIITLNYEHYFAIVGQWYSTNAFMAILAAAFTPVPYKVFTIAAGFWKISLFTLIIASAFGRTARFFIVATIFYFFGAKAKEFIDKYFNWLTILFFILLIGGFVIIKYII